MSEGVAESHLRVAVRTRLLELELILGSGLVGINGLGEASVSPRKGRRPSAWCVSTSCFAFFVSVCLTFVLE